VHHVPALDGHPGVLAALEGDDEDRGVSPGGRRLVGDERDAVAVVLRQ
jgi:hypothetical protein